MYKINTTITSIEQHIRKANKNNNEFEQRQKLLKTKDILFNSKTFKMHVWQFQNSQRSSLVHRR